MLSTSRYILHSQNTRGDKAQSHKNTARSSAAKQFIETLTEMKNKKPVRSYSKGKKEARK